MALPFLIYCSLLKKAQYASLRELDNLSPGLVDLAAVNQAINVSVEQRMLLARDFLTFSQNLVTLTTEDEMANRNAVSRAYYAVHHAVRALLLFEERGDVDGHREAIEAVCALLKRNPAVRSKLGETQVFREAFLDLLDRRHLADYHPFGTNVPNEAPLDFAKAAQEAIDFAQKVVEKADEYIAQKEA